MATPDGCVWTASIDGDVDVWRVKNERHVSEMSMLGHLHYVMFICDFVAYCRVH